MVLPFFLLNLIPTVALLIGFHIAKWIVRLVKGKPYKRKVSPLNFFPTIGTMSTTNTTPNETYKIFRK